MLYFHAQLRAECESAEAVLQLEKEKFEEEKQQFRKTQELQQLIQQCNAVQRAKEASEQGLNNKKLDLLKVKVRCLGWVTCVSCACELCAAEENTFCSH